MSKLSTTTLKVAAISLRHTARAMREAFKRDPANSKHFPVAAQAHEDAAKEIDAFLAEDTDELLRRGLQLTERDHRLRLARFNEDTQ